MEVRPWEHKVPDQSRLLLARWHQRERIGANWRSSERWRLRRRTVPLPLGLLGWSRVGTHRWRPILLRRAPYCPLEFFKVRVFPRSRWPSGRFSCARSFHEGKLQSSKDFLQRVVNKNEFQVGKPHDELDQIARLMPFITHKGDRVSSNCLLKQLNTMTNKRNFLSRLQSSLWIRPSSCPKTKLTGHMRDRWRVRWTSIAFESFF